MVSDEAIELVEEILGYGPADHFSLLTAIEEYANEYGIEIESANKVIEYMVEEGMIYFSGGQYHVE